LQHPLQTAFRSATGSFSNESERPAATGRAQRKRTNAASCGIRGQSPPPTRITGLDQRLIFSAVNPSGSNQCEARV